MAYLGNDLQVAFPTYRNIDDISGSFNGVTTSFPLAVAGVAPIPAPVNSQQCLISVNGVVQRPDDSGTEGFRLNGGNIIFAAAPAGGVDFFGVILAGADYINIGANFPSGTNSAPSITFDSDLDTGIYNPAGNHIGFTTAGVQRIVINSSGQLSGSLASAAAPAFSFISDPNTGIYSPGADQVAISTGGSGRLFVDASGNIGIGIASPAYPLDVRPTGLGLARIGSQDSQAGLYISSGNNTSPFINFLTSTSTLRAAIFAGASSDDLIFATGASGTERARIDSSGRLLVGTSSSTNNSRLSQRVSIVGVGGGNADHTGLALTGYHTTTAGTGPVLDLSRSRGATDGAMTVVQSNDVLGYLTYRGADGTSFLEAARIDAYVDGTPGANDMPGRLVFSTTADGAGSPTERMRIAANGDAVFSNLTTIYPITDNAVQLGGGGTRFTAVYAVNGTIQTSDQREKTEVTTSFLGSDFIKSLRPVSYKWIEGGQRHTGEYDDNNNYIYEAVPGERTHWGFIAQEVKQAVDATGVDFGGWILTDKDDPDSQQALRYDQFIAPLTKALQETMAELEALKAEVAALKAQ